MSSYPAVATEGFFSKDGHVRRSKLEGNMRRKLREAEEAAELLRVDQVAELLAGHDAPAPQPEAGVVRPVRHRGQTAAALKPLRQAEPAPAAPAFIDAFVAAAARLRIVE